MAKLYTKNTWQDEILAGDELYNINQADGTPISSDVQIQLSTGVAQPGTALDAARMNNIEDGLDAVDTRLDEVDGRLEEAETELTEVDGRVDDHEALELARYKSNAAITIPNGADTIMQFDAQVYDPLSRVTTGTGWKFTAARAGYYLVGACATFSQNAGWSAGTAALMRIFRNGAMHSNLARWFCGGTNESPSLTGTDLIFLEVGDTLDIRLNQTTTGARTTVSSGDYNWVSIVRVLG
jgi:hypothetical protein